MENILSTATIRNFAKKSVLFLWQVDVKVYLANFLLKRPVQICVSITSFLKNGMKIYCVDLEICHNTVSLLQALKNLKFKRSFVLCALSSFPMDISEDFCDDFRAM